MIGRHMQDCGVCFSQLLTADAVGPQLQFLHFHVIMGVHPADIFIAGILNPIDLIPSQQLHNQRVKIFGTGADDHLVSAHLHPAAAV